jgi:hypothetical protein
MCPGQWASGAPRLHLLGYAGHEAAAGGEDLNRKRLIALALLAAPARAATLLAQRGFAQVQVVGGAALRGSGKGWTSERSPG